MKTESELKLVPDAYCVYLDCHGSYLESSLQVRNGSKIAIKIDSNGRCMFVKVGGSCLRSSLHVQV